MATLRALSSSSRLSGKKCRPCEGGVAALSKNQSREYLKLLDGWVLAPNAKSISLDLRMKDFAAAMRLINQIAKVAEAEGHHPDFHLTSYRNLRVELSTHAIGGLSENDFILAAKIDRLSASARKQRR